MQPDRPLNGVGGRLARVIRPFVTMGAERQPADPPREFAPSSQIHGDHVDLLLFWGVRRTRKFGPYQLLYLLASGGMGEIHRARDARRSDGREVALKRLLPIYNEDDDFIVMLTDEARLTSLFDHEHLGRVYEFGVVEGQHFLAMELIEGVDFRRALRRSWARNEQLSGAAVAYVVESALRGLHAAHELRAADGRSLDIVHRDFSPSNIRLTFAGGVKLIDFGIAKAKLSRARTQSGVVKGKVKFMSPEQTERRRLDARSDLFSAGVVLYYALARRTPFAADGSAELMRVIREEPHRPLASVATVEPGLAQIVEQSLQKDPRDRFQSAADMADALARWRARVAPTFGAPDVGEMLCEMFAAERREDAELYQSYADGLGRDGEGTGTQSYTRLVGVG